MRPLRVALAGAIGALREAGVPSPSVDAGALVAHVLGVAGGEVSRLVVLGRDLDDGQAERLDALVADRAARVPLQHLTGRAGFRYLELQVGPGVFVPRPETERLAEEGVAEASRLVAAGEGEVRVVELCAGSGAVGLSVAAEVPGSRVTLLELDPLAASWAGRNVDALGLAGRVDLVVADVAGAAAGVLSGLAGAVDVVLANPPYIPDGMEPVDPEVRDHDPQVALYGGGADGLAVPRAVVATSARLLRDGGLFAMEHADVQAEAARSMLPAPGWAQVVTLPDLTGRPRVVRARRVRHSTP